MSDFFSGGWSLFITGVTLLGLAGCLWLLFVASKRTGPDLHRVGGKYSDEWHRIHLLNPRDLVPESNMPAYPWLATRVVEPAEMAPKMRALRRVGVPYVDDEIAKAAEDVKGRTELEAVIAYLQVLGTAVK